MYSEKPGNGKCVEVILTKLDWILNLMWWVTLCLKLCAEISIQLNVCLGTLHLQLVLGKLFFLEFSRHLKVYSLFLLLRKSIFFPLSTFYFLAILTVMFWKRAAWRNKLFPEEKHRPQNNPAASGFSGWMKTFTALPALIPPPINVLISLKGNSNHTNTLMGGSLWSGGRNHSPPAEKLSYPVTSAKCLLRTVRAFWSVHKCSVWGQRTKHAADEEKNGSFVFTSAY